VPFKRGYEDCGNGWYVESLHRRLLQGDIEHGLMEALSLRILLVGGLGFIGRHLIHRLSIEHHLVIVSDREGVEEASRSCTETGLVVEIADITDGNSVMEVLLRHRPEAVVHLAALTGIAKCNNDPRLSFHTNVLGTYNVVVACVACRCKLIFISSREVYGDTISDLTGENAPLIPNNVYGVTKMMGEMLVRWASSKYGLDYTILRITNIYGPGGDQYNVQAMVREALSKRRIRVLGGKQRMNLIFVGDVVEVITRCLSDPRTSRQVFNVGSGDDLSVEEVVAELVPLLPFPVEIEHESMREGETMNFRPNLEKMQNTLELHTTTTLPEGLRRTVDWYLSQSGQTGFRPSRQRSHSDRRA
jgi:UDP-glucose 4-epimerase